MSNNGGGEFISREAEFALYDSLPPEVRRALQDAPIPLGSRTARTLLLNHYAKEVAVVLEQRTREYMQSCETESTLMRWTWRGGKMLKASRGSDHPQAQDDCKWNYQLKPWRHRRVRLTRRQRIA